MLMSTDEHAALMAALRRSNELFEQLEAAPPSPEEQALQAQNPRTPRTQILRLLVRQRLTA
jgi:hypothetical protein